MITTKNNGSVSMISQCRCCRKESDLGFKTKMLPKIVRRGRDCKQYGEDKEITKDTELDPDQVDRVREKVLEIVKNPAKLIYSPSKTADAVKEISDAIGGILKT